MSFSLKILVGVLLGVALGLFLGERVAALQVVADIYVKLLQMTVLPYLTVSLVSGLGGLKLEQAKALAVRCSMLLLMLWSVALAAVFLFPLMFPRIETASFFSTTLLEGREPFNFVSLFIPDNPFSSLANNVVPAVVLFSVVLGLALIGVPGKERLIDVLQIARAAISKATTLIVSLTPYGLFAVAAVAAGTLDPIEFNRVQVYLVAYVAISLFLGLWVLPGLVAALTAIPYGAVLNRNRDALLTAFMTGNLFIVLPALTEQTKVLLREYQHAGAYDETLVDVIVPASFNFPHTGKLLAISFVLFAGWSSDALVPLRQYPRLAATGLLVLFGNVNGAVPFLLDTFRIPSDTFQLFLTTSIVNARFGTLVAAVHTLTLGLLGPCAIAGLVHLNARKMVRYAVVTSILAVMIVTSTRAIAARVLGGSYDRDQALMAMGTLRQYEQAQIRQVDDMLAASGNGDESGGRVEEIRSRGVLRVAYMPDSLPFAFVNARSELVGFDVEMAHILASDLGVSLEFVEVPRAGLATHLDGATADLAMSGVSVTVLRAAQMAFSASYLDETLAFIVPDHRRDAFASWEAVRSQGRLRIGVPPLPYYLAKIRADLPGAEIVPLVTADQMFTGTFGFDAVILTAERGSAWTLLHPQYSVVVPMPQPIKVPLAYPVAAHDEALATLVSTWIGLKQKDGTIDQLFAHWILGRDTVVRQPRWSIIRDVLHWVE